MKQKNTQTTTSAVKKPARPRKRVANEKKLPLPTTPELAPEEPAPVYELPTPQENTKQLDFTKIISNENILVALEKTSYKTPSEDLAVVLPAALRGSDTLVYKSKQADDFLISAIPAISRLVYSEDSEKKELSPKTVLLFPSAESLNSAFSSITEVFHDFGIQFARLNTEAKLEDINETKNVDILFATPANLLETQKNKDLQLNHVKFLCVHELNSFDSSGREALNNCMEILPNEKMQKIFVSYQNTPRVREFVFKYLEDPEIFSFLPQFVTEQYPRQFAHALEATQKFQVLLGYLKTYKPRAALVVANSKTVAEWIAFKLHGNSIKVSLITSALSPYPKRTKFLSSVANGETQVFVCTDYAIKNFGVESLNCVYHFDLPDNPTLYLERLNKIQGARNPISIAFICEDYGFNMKKIEELLSCKIRITTPDKNFFEFKDTSEYPLESSGRVKTIGQQEEKEVVESKVDAPQTVSQAVASEPVLEETKPQQGIPRHQAPKPQRTPVAQQTKKIQTSESTASLSSENFSTQSTSKTPSRHHQPDTSKFVRRDDRAREALADALLAAKIAEEKRKASSSQKPPNMPPRSDSKPEEKTQNIVSSVFFVLSEALRAGAHAASESLAQTTEHRFPLLHRLLKRPKK